jgi:PAS domain S-box-containing protein
MSNNYSFSDLVDTDKIKELLTSFYELTGFISALEDLDGNILECTAGYVAIGWHDICLDFHRKHPETLKKCIESGTKICDKLKAGETQSSHICLNGLVDIAVPICIEGEHLANLFTGQFFFEPPNIEFFREQAHKYGFDEEKYLKALSKVDVFSEEFIEKGMSFLTNLASVIGEMGLEKKKLLDSKRVLQESEERYRALVENSPDAIFRINKELRFLYGNHGADTFNLSVEDLIGKSFKELPLSKEMRDMWVGNIDKTIITGEIQEIEFKFPSIHGLMFCHTHIIPEYNTEGAIETVVLVNRDITKHKKAKLALKENEKRFRALINNATDLIRILDEDGLIIFDSPSSKRILGYPEGYFIGKDPLDFIHPEDLERVNKELQDVYNKQNSQIPTEFRIKRADGKYVLVESLSQNLIDVPGINGIVVTTNPIIKRKKTENMLRFQANILNNVRDCVIVYDLQGRIIYWNKGAEDIYGYLEEEIIGKDIKILYLNRAKSQFKLDLEETLRSGEYNGEWEGKRKDGSKMYVDIRETVMYDVNGKITGIIGVSKDISERKKVEKQIKRSEAYYRTIFENTGTATIIVEEDTTVSLANAEFEKLYGYPKEEIEGKKNWREFVAPDYINKIEEYHIIRRINPKLAPRNYEFKFIDRYGKFKDIFVTVAIIPETNKSLVSLLDITNNKKDEKALKEFGVSQTKIAKALRESVASKSKILNALRRSEAQLKMAMDMAKLAQWEYDFESAVFTFDDQFYALYNTTVKEEGPQMSPEDYVRRFVPFEDRSRVNEEIARIWETTNVYDSGQLEHSIIMANGEVRFIAVHYEIIKDDEGRAIKTYGTNQDITEIKVAENKIKNSLMEKEVLLREIHHRVKNNLQIISSLLNLQTRCVEGEETINVLKESQNRVKTMAMVHEKLYQSENLKDINFREYIENLVSDLFYSYGVKRGTIDLQINADNLEMDIDTAIPCGLIINELVTNSLKYAFPYPKGIVKIELKQLQDKLELIISDNGRGLPDDLDIETTETLGLKMVTILVNQLKGTLELDRTNGTEFRIIFRELEYKSRI